MAHLTWSVLWTAFALVAAAPDNYGYSDYGNYVQQPQSPNADVPSGFDCSGKENGAYGNGCSKDYWLCWDGVATNQECSFDLMFNQENGQCDFANNVFACSGERPTTLAPLDSSTMEPVDFDCSSLEDGDYPFAHKCQVEYVSCVAGAPWKRSCPDDLSFDPENRICDRLENIIACGGSPPTAAEPVEISFECPSPSGSFALVSALCSPTYYICENNKPTIAMCSDEMIWDDAHKECRMPSDIPDCSFDCSGKADAPYSIGCSQNYWWCWEGKATKLACPEGMMFNGENGQCDFENNIFECTGQHVTPSPTSASDFATPPPVDFDCSSVEDGNHAFKNGAQCQPKFVSCVGGVAWELTCPDGLLFDPDQLLCERVERIVACGGSLEETTTQSYDNSYSSYNKPTTPRPHRKIHKTTLAEVPITRRAYHQKMTTIAAEQPTELPSDNYGYETTVRRRHHKTTLAAEPTTRRSYYQTTTLAAEPTTELRSDYGDYDTTTARRRLHKTTTPAAEPTTRRSYYQTTTPAEEPTTTTSYDDSYGNYETTTLAEPITTTRRSSYGHKRITTPAAEPTTRQSYYQTTPAAEPTTKKSYGRPSIRHISKPVTRRNSYYQTTTPAAEPTTRASYYQKTTTMAEPTTRRSYYQTTTMAEPTTRASYYQKKTTTMAEPTTRRSYYQTTTPAAEPTTRASYYQKKTTTLADIPITRRSYYQTTTPAAEPTTTQDSYGNYETTTLAEPITTTRRSSYGHKRITTPVAQPTTRRSYYQTTRLAEPTTRQPYSRPVIRRLLPKPKVAAQPIIRQSYYQATTPAAEPVTRRSYNQKRLTTTPAAEPITRQSYYQTTPAAEPITRRTYKLTAEEPTTRKPQFKQSSYY